MFGKLISILKENPKKIVFTEQARKIEHILRKEITESEELLLQGITEEERKEFLRIAEKMLRNLE